MPLLLPAQLIVAGVLLAFALLHFLIGIKHPNRTLHITFALTALAAAGESLTTAWRYHSGSVPDLVLAARWSGAFQFMFGALMVWFVYFYAPMKKAWVPWAIMALTLALVTLQFTLSFGLLYDGMPELRQTTLAWGEKIATPLPNPTRALLFGHSISLSEVVYVVSSIASVWKRGAGSKAVALSLGYAPVLLVAWPEGILVNRGLISAPYLYSYAFMALVLLMSFDMVGETVRAARLSKTVEAQSRRWGALLENVQLLVAGCTDNGVLNFVNPHLIQVTGYSEAELLGRHVQDFIARAPNLTTHAGSPQDGDGAAAGYFKSDLRKKDGGFRSIHWSSVRLFDDHGVAAGYLSIGSDLTEQELAEKARDDAFHRLEEMAARIEGENLYLKEEVGITAGRQTIVGESPALRYVLHQIRLVAKTQASVLIEGETGVGKELVARAIHELSDRSSGPFIGLNCAAMSPTLVEGELFGAEKGAYTGADKARKGRFELADGGTLFLDEIGELAQDLQAKLLRVLQEGEFERIGGQQSRRVDVRIIAATNRNLPAEIAAGRFREDLYYRLGVYPITVPPLRERREDIPLLVHYLVQMKATRHGKRITEVPGHMMKVLSGWDWPGNIRELANVIERAVILTSGSVLTMPPDFGRSPSAGESKAPGSYGSLSEVERKHILDVLEHTNWKIYGPGGAAEILDMNPNTLRSRMAKIGITKESRSAIASSTESRSLSSRRR
jgi:PAS domain S-box-containing protein